MAQAKDLFKAISALTQAYGEDMKEHETTKKRLKRAEMKIRDLTVEIQYLVDQLDIETNNNRMDTFQEPPTFSSASPPAYAEALSPP